MIVFDDFTYSEEEWDQIETVVRDALNLDADQIERVLIENSRIYRGPRASAPPALLVPINLFPLFVALLGFDRKRRDRSRFEPLQRDRLARFLTIAIGIVFNPLQGGVNLGDQLSLPVTGAQLDGAVGFRGRAIGEVGKVDVLFLKSLQRNLQFAEDIVLPCQQLGAKIFALALVHERLFFGGPVVLQLFQMHSCSVQGTGRTVRLRRSLYSGRL